MKWRVLDLIKGINKTEQRDEKAAARFPRVSTPTPIAVLLDQEARAALAEYVCKLEDRQRMVITLRYWAGLDWKEISEALENTEAAVRSLYHRALEELLRKWKHGYGKER